MLATALIEMQIGLQGFNGLCETLSLDQEKRFHRKRLFSIARVQ